MTAGENRHYQSMIAQLPFGYAYHRIITDSSGEAVDYTFLAVNAAFEQLLNLKAKDIIHKNASELFPDIRTMDFDWIKTFGEVAATGKPTIFEQYFESLNCWYSVYAASPKKGYFSVLFRDISSEKAHEKNLKDSEEKFSKAFQLAPFAITLTDGETEKIIEVNDAFVASTGFSRDETIGRSSSQLALWVSDEARASVIADLRNGIPVRGREYQFRNKDGSLVYGFFSASVVSIRNKPYVLGSIEDITEKKRLAESLEKELAFRKYLFENAKDGYVLLSHEHRVLDANKQFCRLLGYSLEELKHMHVWDYHSGMSRADIQNVYNADDLVADIFETRFNNKDGVAFHVEVNAWAFDWRGEKRIFCACRDLTARKYKEMKAGQAND